MADVLDLLARKFPVAVDSETLAHAAKVSTRRLRVLFQEELQMSLRAFTACMRVAAIDDAAGDGSRTLESIAPHAGFADAAQLSKAYRRLHGRPPRRPPRRRS
jgi:transcriptional regulator GlxA family with amidase domain